jgi:hypothetical protein
MIRPSPGLMCTHNTVPVEFLHLVRDVDGAEEWLVKPLFVSDQKTRLATVRPGDRLTPLHSQAR